MNVNPVSYTHLDVYKRQDEDNMLTRLYNMMYNSLEKQDSNFRELNDKFDRQSRDINELKYEIQEMHKCCLLYTSRCV